MCIVLQDALSEVGNAGSGLENQSRESGSERKSDKKEVQGESLARQEEKRLPEELHESGGQEAVTSWRERGELMPWRWLPLKDLKN